MAIDYDRIRLVSLANKSSGTLPPDFDYYQEVLNLLDEREWLVKALANANRQVLLLQGV